MSNYSLRPAITSQAKPLIGLYAESGAGKTYSALLMACGYVNGDMSKVAMIETEAGRGEAFADDPVVGGYLVRPIRNDFAPSEYGAALTEVEKAGVKVCIIDSASHEWEGANGVLSQAADNQASGKKGPIVWQKPKMSHQREFMLRLMQTPIDLVIVCMRAKYPMKEIERNGKKEWTRSENLEPKQADDILFEMFVHGWIDQDHKFRGTKYTRDNMRKIIKDGERITVDTGKRLAAWASGKTNAEPPQPTIDSPVDSGQTADGSAPSTEAGQGVIFPAAKSDARDSEPTVPASTNSVHAQINEALGFSSAALTGRFLLKLAGKKVEDLDDTAARKALAFLNAEMDKQP